MAAENAGSPEDGQWLPESAEEMSIIADLWGRVWRLGRRCLVRSSCGIVPAMTVDRSWAEVEGVRGFGSVDGLGEREGRASMPASAKGLVNIVVGEIAELLTSIEMSIGASCLQNWS